MSNISIFANSEALIGGMLHLNDLIKKGVENGNVLDVIQRQKIGLRNVLQAQKSGVFTDTIEAHEHLFFWAPVLEYYCKCNKADFDAAKFSAKYKILHQEQSRAASGSVERSGAAVSEERETGKAGAVPTGMREENRRESTGGGNLRDNARPIPVGVGESVESNNGGGGVSLGVNPAPAPVPTPAPRPFPAPAQSPVLMRSPAPAPASAPMQVRRRRRPRPRPLPQVMQVNQNPRVSPKPKAAGPGPEEASGSKARSKPKAVPRSKSRAKPKASQDRDRIPVPSTGMQHHILALQIFDEPEPAPSHTYRQISLPPLPPTSRLIRPPSTLLSKMTITPKAGESSQRPRPVREDKDMGDGTESDLGLRVDSKKRKRDAEKEDQDQEKEDQDEDDSHEDDGDDEDDEDDDDDPDLAKVLPGSKLRYSTGDQKTRPPPIPSKRAFAVRCLRCKRKGLDCVQVESRRSGGSCFYCALAHERCQTGLEDDGDKGKGKEKGKGKSKGKGKAKANMGNMGGIGLAATPAKKRVRLDNSMSGSGAALEPAFNPALADITGEDVTRWKALDEILPLLEDRIEKLEAIVDNNSRAFDKSRQQVKKNVDVILVFDDEIGKLFDAMGDMQERVSKLERTSVGEHAREIVAGENAGPGGVSLPPLSLPRPTSVNQPAPIFEGQRSPQPVVDPSSASPTAASAPVPDSAPAADLAVAPDVRPASSSTTAHTLAPATHLPSDAGPGPGPDPYLHRKSDPNRPVHGCIYHNITGNVIWRYHPDSSNTAPLANEDVDMEHSVATIATPTTSTSSGDMPSLPVASYSPEENKASSLPPPRLLRIASRNNPL